MTEYYRRHLDDTQVHRRWLDPRLSQVRVDAIRSYLLGKHWKPVPADRPGVLVFEEPTVDPDGPLYQWVPESEQGRDYAQQIFELIAAIAEIEDRYAGDVLTDVLREPVGTNGTGATRHAQQTPG